MTMTDEHIKCDEITPLTDPAVQLVRFELPGGAEVFLHNTPDVWLPHEPTFEFLRALASERVLAEGFRGKNVLDVGTGSGIIGMFALLNGAQTATMTDINPRALQVTEANLEQNGLGNGTGRSRVVKSDVYMGIVDKFDTIISNPPVQPQNPFAHADNPAAKFNESRGEGRYVLDSLIEYGKQYLKPNGRQYILCSSRHGHGRTIELLNATYGEGNWNDLVEPIEYEIDPEYHGPYMAHWIAAQKADHDIRVYAKTTDDEVVYPDVYDPEDESLRWFSVSHIIEARNVD